MAGVYNIICEDRTTHVRYAVIFDDGILKGVPCRNGTSCPDQFARALEAELAKRA